MAFPPGFLDELRSRVSLAGLIGRKVKLVRRGREQAGLCPFHHEKTPSFYVVEDKAFFHCFGCGAHGDVIGFVMRADNLDFLEAVEKLAGEAGLAVPQSTPEEQGRARRQKTLLEVLEAAAVFYEDRLWAPAGRPAQAYLRTRGLDDEAIRCFRLGWAPSDGRALRRNLAVDFPEALLIEAGLLHRSDEGEPFDYFRGRVMFPIGDRAGRVIAFGGRVLGDGQPKYLNSPEHPLFEKGRILYGWSAARAAKGERPDPIVTEGYMDVIALNRAGFATAVAPLGTALTEFQLRELWRLGSQPILCFDGDAAGQRAAVRALRRALPLLRPGYSLQFASLPPGEDPDSLVRRGGRTAFEEEVLKSARRMASMLWETEVGARPIDTEERRADLRRRLVEDIDLIADRSVKEQYRAYLLNYRFREATWGARDRRKLSALKPGEAWFVEDRGRPPSAPAPRQREILLRILLQFPEVIDEFAEPLMAVDIPELELDKLRCEILQLAALRPGLDAPALRQHLLLNGFAAAVDRLLSPSVDTAFLARRSDPGSVRKDCAHVIGMLMQDDPGSVLEAGSHMTGDVSSESWERFLAARARAMPEGLSEGEEG
jgi:DNA primase